MKDELIEQLEVEDDKKRIIHPFRITSKQQEYGLPGLAEKDARILALEAENERLREQLRQRDEFGRSEESLRQSEEDLINLSRFPSENPAPIMRFSKYGIIIYANNASKVLMESCGCSIGDNVPEQWQKLVMEAHESQRVCFIEVESGNDIFELMASPIPEASYVNVYGRKITEQKRMQEELIKLNRMHRALSSCAHLCLHVTDEIVLLQEVCRIVTEDCGHTMVWIGFADNDNEKKVRPVAFSGFDDGYLETVRVTWDDSDYGRGPTGRAIRTAQICVCTNILTEPDVIPWRAQAINRGYVSSIAFPLISDGHAFGALTIYSKDPDPFSPDEIDLLMELVNYLAQGIITIRLRTAKSRAEEDLYLLTHTLEQKVSDRTSQIESLNLELESIAYSLSHDLRTPLRAIDGFNQMLLAEYGDKLDDNARGYIDRVKNGAKKAWQQMDAVLDLMKLAREEITRTDINLSAIANAIVLQHKEANPDGHISFEIQNDITAYANEQLMTIVLQNLIDNSIKFTGKKQHGLIAFASYQLNGETIYFVKDNGVGFDMKYQQKLFTIFQRLHVQEFEGIGIGLASVRHLILKHGGRVWAEGEEGKGATFYFSLG